MACQMQYCVRKPKDAFAPIFLLCFVTNRQIVHASTQNKSIVSPAYWADKLLSEEAVFQGVLLQCPDRPWPRQEPL